MVKAEKEVGRRRVSAVSRKLVEAYYDAVLAVVWTEQLGTRAVLSEAVDDQDAAYEALMKRIERLERNAARLRKITLNFPGASFAGSKPRRKTVVMRDLRNETELEDDYYQYVRAVREMGEVELTREEYRAVEGMVVEDDHDASPRPDYGMCPICHDYITYADVEDDDVMQHPVSDEWVHKQCVRDERELG